MKAQMIAIDLVNYLKRNANHRGHIHSVFNESFNIVDQKGELITCLTPSKDIEPMSVILAMTSREIQTVVQEDDVEFTNDGFLLSKTNRLVSLKGAKRWDPTMLTAGVLNPWAVQQERIESIKQILMEEGSMLGIAPLIHSMHFEEDQIFLIKHQKVTNEYCQFIEERVIDLLQRVSDQDYQATLDQLPKIIGFGPGLTPSTDDLLAGIMISLCYDSAITSENTETVSTFLAQISKVCLGRTTKVSEEMIKHASKGMVSESYRQLIRGIYFESATPFDECVRRVLRHGASSGADFLLGVYSINRMRLNKVKRRQS